MTVKKLSKIHQRVLTSHSQTPASINRQIDKLVEQGMQIDRSKDADVMANLTQTWEDLNALRTQLAETVMTFTGQVYGLINNTDVLSVLGEQRTHFDKLVQTFFADVEAFSTRVASLRVQHEDRTGKVDALDDYGLFMNLSLQYQNASDELNVLVTPTLSELVMIVHERVDSAKQSAALIDPTVISDLPVKE